MVQDFSKVIIIASACVVASIGMFSLCCCVFMAFSDSSETLLIQLNEPTTTSQNQ